MKSKKHHAQKNHKNTSRFFIVGAPKAGTYSLYEILSQHPNISMSSIKEPNFFTTAANNSLNMKIVTNFDDYTALWGFNQKNTIYGEASPSYLRCADAPMRIKETFPNAKIIVVLRDPIERAYSNWKMDVRQGGQKASFKRAFYADYENKRSANIQYEYYKASLYYEAIERYFSIFGRENVLTFLFEDLQESTPEACQKILQFLQLPDFDTVDYRIENAAKLPRFQFLAKAYQNKFSKLTLGRILPEPQRKFIKDIIFSGKPDNSRPSIELRQELLPLFREDIRNLEKTLKRDLSSWLKT